MSVMKNDALYLYLKWKTIQIIFATRLDFPISLDRLMKNATLRRSIRSAEKDIGCSRSQND